jgi:hypothetical protein
VVDLLVHRACHASPLAEALDDQIADDVRASVKRFLETYTAIDWHDLHGRLQHFRNRGHSNSAMIDSTITCSCDTCPRRSGASVQLTMTRALGILA